MWVVKLGGSLMHSQNLPLWLEALADTGAVIVPGGGPFADAVREAQKQWGFDDPTAHHMAILGMRQYGRMLAGLCPRLLTATSAEDLGRPEGRAKVWLPLPEQLDAADIPAAWEITSDSLAAWLAGNIRADHLLLVKSAVPLAGMQAPPELTCAELAQQGLIDPAFRRYRACGPFESWLCGPNDHAGLAHALVDPARRFIRMH